MAAGLRIRASVPASAFQVAGCPPGAPVSSPTVCQSATASEATVAPTICAQQHENVEYAPFWIAGRWDHGTLDFLPTQSGDEGLRVSPYPSPAAASATRP